MSRAGEVWIEDIQAGLIKETEFGYSFEYLPSYLERKDAVPISLTMPLRSEPYNSNVLFPFFDGLLPEGWLLQIALDEWKLDRRDRFSLLLKCCKDCVGAVSIKEVV